MTERNAVPTHTDESAEAWARPLVERQLAVLGELAELGLEVARAVERQARAPDADLNRVSMAYARAARAVRMTIALQSRLIEELKAREAAEQRAEAAADDAPDETEIHKIRVGRIVERVLESEGRDDAEIDRLILKAERLLDDEDLYDDVLSHPIGDLVARICRDLGLSPDWPRLAEDAWARREIAEGAEGSPFAQWMADHARPPPLAGDPKGRGGMRRRCGMPPQSLRDSSPASGGARADPEGVEGACGRRTFHSNAPDG